jgi:trk system potassium uptake protein TrkA
VSWTTDQVLRRLLPGAYQPDWVDGSGKVALVERVLPTNWAGRLLWNLSEPGRFNLSAVTRLGEARVIDTTTVGQEGDVLHFITNLDSLDSLQERLTEPETSGSH